MDAQQKCAKASVMQGRDIVIKVALYAATVIIINCDQSGKTEHLDALITTDRTWGT
jgi:hypothetical protein